MKYKDGEVTAVLDIMLVDDDDLVRKGLSKIIKWDELGARVVYSAHYGA